MLNERVELLIKRSTNAMDNNKLLVHKYASVERERDALRTLNAMEKQRNTDMETLLHSSRIVQAQSLRQSTTSRPEVTAVPE